LRKNFISFVNKGLVHRARQLNSWKWRHGWYVG